MRPRRDFPDFSRSILRSLLAEQGSNPDLFLPEETGPPYAIPLDQALETAIKSRGLDFVKYYCETKLAIKILVQIRGKNSFYTIDASVKPREIWGPEDLWDALYDEALLAVDHFLVTYREKL